MSSSSCAPPRSSGFSRGQTQTREASTKSNSPRETHLLRKDNGNRLLGSPRRGWHARRKRRSWSWAPTMRRFPSPLTRSSRMRTVSASLPEFAPGVERNAEPPASGRRALTLCRRLMRRADVRRRHKRLAVFPAAYAMSLASDCRLLELASCSRLP